MKQQESKSGQGFREGRHLERLDDKLHDPFESRGKLPTPSVCSICGAVYETGRWHWARQGSPAGAHMTHCPACERTAQGMPAGIINIRGEIPDGLRAEMLQMMRNREEQENREHPLQRIMSIHEEPGRIEVATTDVHLAQGLGHALRDAYGGRLEQQFAEDEHMVRIQWTR